jgi:hypothetical protein
MCALCQSSGNTAASHQVHIDHTHQSRAHRLTACENREAGVPPAMDAVAIRPACGHRRPPTDDEGAM